jgi:4-amino-4-deoxy-L-arabinose transferase-like glycosyltransferase
MDVAAGERSRGHARRTLLVVVVASLALKLALLVPTHDVPVVRDSADYLENACTLLRAGHYGQSGRAPGYPVVLAATFRLAELAGLRVRCPRDLYAPRGGILAVTLARSCQVSWSTLTVLLAFLLARALFDERAALATAGLVAFYPNLVGYSHLLWTETLYVMLSFAWALLLVHGVRRDRWSALGAAGLLLGCGALVRQTGMPTIGLAVVWLWVLGVPRWRPLLARALVVVAGAALVIAPWTVRNWRVYDQVVLISTTGGQAMLYGASPNVRADLRRLSARGIRPFTLAYDRAARARAREIVRHDPSAWVKRMVTINLPSLWHPGYEGVIDHLVDEDGYPHVSPGLARLGIVVVVGSYVLLGVVAMIGLAFAPAREARWLVLGLAVLYGVLHTVVWGLPRHRLPVMAFATLPAGWVLSRRWAEWRQRATPRRVLAAGLGVLAFLTLVWSNDPTMLRRQWEQAATLPHEARSVAPSGGDAAMEARGTQDEQQQE